MVIEGDFVPGVVARKTKLKPETGYNVFPFPAIGDATNVVVGGGDSITMFRDTPAIRAFVEFLASPEGAQAWAERGGFSSPNKGVGDDAYPDEITAHDRDRDRRRGDVPLRHVRPRAGRVRRHAGSGRVEDPAGLPREPGRRGRDGARSWSPPRRRRSERRGSGGSVEASAVTSPASGAPGSRRRRGRGSARDRLVPVLFLAPAIVFLAVWLVYPTIRTSIRSFFDRDGSDFVGFDNYEDLFTTDTLTTAIKNNAIWVAVVPALVTAIGLIFAVLTERIRWSTAFKTVVFMPMAISLFAAGVIWRVMDREGPVAWDRQRGDQGRGRRVRSFGRADDRARHRRRR